MQHATMGLTDACRPRPPVLRNAVATIEELFVGLCEDRAKAGLVSGEEPLDPLALNVGKFSPQLAKFAYVCLDLGAKPRTFPLVCAAQEANQPLVVERQFSLRQEIPRHGRCLTRRLSRCARNATEAMPPGLSGTLLCLTMTVRAVFRDRSSITFAEEKLD